MFKLTATSYPDPHHKLGFYSFWEGLAQFPMFLVFLLTFHIYILYTVEPFLKDCPIGHKNMVSQDRWSLVTGSVALKYGTFCHEYVVFQDSWSLMSVVSQDRFHCMCHCSHRCDISQNTHSITTETSKQTAFLKP